MFDLSLTHSQEVDTTGRRYIFHCTHQQTTSLIMIINLLSHVDVIRCTETPSFLSEHPSSSCEDGPPPLCASTHVIPFPAISQESDLTLVPKKSPRQALLPAQTLRPPRPPTLRTPPLPPLPPRLGPPPPKPHKPLLLPPPIQTDPAAHHPPFLAGHERAQVEVGPKAVGGEPGWRGWIG